jgi:ATP-dependent exoDNAse (exonuclease V) beta subunit
VNQYTGARGGRHYEVEGYQFDFASVTSITGIVNKFGIPDYYKRKGIEKAISVMAQPGAQERLALSATLKNERARKHKDNTWQTELYEEAKSGPQDAMDIAANFGNDSHELIERLALRDIGKGQDIGNPAEQYIPIIEGFQAWFRDSGLQILASELMVYHAAYKYAGTIDLVCRHAGSAELVVIDVKTGGVFDEAAMQVSAYATALEYLTNDPVSEAWVLQLPRERPDKWDADKLYEVHKVKSIPAYHDAFIGAMQLQERLKEEAWIT